MKKIITLALTLTTLLTLIGCSASSSTFNYDMFDTEYGFDYAIIDRYDGEQKVAIKQWRDFEDGDQIQITTTDGTTMLLHSSRVILVKEH